MKNNQRHIEKKNLDEEDVSSVSKHSVMGFSQNFDRVARTSFNFKPIGKHPIVVITSLADGS